MPPTLCELTRRALEEGNRCSCPGNPSQPQCDGKAEAPDSCKVLKLAAMRDVYSKRQYDPTFLVQRGGSQVREAELGIMGRIVKDLEDDVTQIYGTGTPVEDISYGKMQRCLNKPDGSRDCSTFNGKKTCTDKYVSRDNLKMYAGYNPQPVVGGSLLEGKVPHRATNFIPVWTDRIANPTLVLVFILVVLLVAAWALFLRPTPEEQERAKVMDLVLEYEKAGVCMKEYRAKLGMEPSECQPGAVQPTV